MSDFKVTFRGLDNNPSLAAMARRCAEALDSVAGVGRVSCQAIFEAPPTFAASDQLWLHLEASCPDGDVWLTRTQPKGERHSVEDFVRRSFASIARSLRPADVGAASAGAGIAV